MIPCLQNLIDYLGPMNVSCSSSASHATGTCRDIQHQDTIKKHRGTLDIGLSYQYYFQSPILKLNSFISVTLEHLRMPIMIILIKISGLHFLANWRLWISFIDTLPTSLLVMSRTKNQAPDEAICSLKDLSLLVQVAPPTRQIGRQEATAWQVEWLWQHSYQSVAFQEIQA